MMSRILMRSMTNKNVISVFLCFVSGDLQTASKKEKYETINFCRIFVIFSPMRRFSRSN